jgi:hypothetical protein
VKDLFGNNCLLIIYVLFFLNLKINLRHWINHLTDVEKSNSVLVGLMFIIVKKDIGQSFVSSTSGPDLKMGNCDRFC